MEYLRSVVTYQSAPPPFDLNELVNQWEDWVDHPLAVSQLPIPPYNQKERTLLQVVDSSWEAFCATTPQTINVEALALSSAEWLTFVAAASSALQEMDKRGKLAEE
jgi:hypothetical protein